MALLLFTGSPDLCPNVQPRTPHPWTLTSRPPHEADPCGHDPAERNKSAQSCINLNRHLTQQRHGSAQLLGLLRPLPPSCSFDVMQGAGPCSPWLPATVVAT